MKFSLCYKDYEYKITWAAKLEFKQETGRGLWSTLQGVMPVVQENSDGSTMNMLAAIGRHIDDVDGTFLLWVLAKQCNSALTLAEIADACDRAGWRPVSDDSAYAQPYTYVIYKILLDVDNWYEERAIKAKKSLCPFEGEQD